MTDDENSGEKDVDRLIDVNLKRVFAALEKEAVPDRFKELLERLQSQEKPAPPDE